MVIGKSKNPRCFKGVKSLEVDYYFNKKAWMTSVIFEEWIMKLDKKMGQEKRKIALIVDNCPAHPVHVKSKLKNIELIFFPPNLTSKLQPMDQGVIKNLKLYYRKKLVQKIIITIEENQTVDKNFINLRESIAILSKAWTHDVSAKTVENCFKKAGFSTSLSIWVEEDDLQLAELKRSWDMLKTSNIIDKEISFDDFVSVDENIVTTEIMNDVDILESVKNPFVEEESENEENSLDMDEKNPTRREVEKAFSTIRKSFQAFENVPEHVFFNLDKCEHFYDNKVNFSHKRQTNITSYFQNQ